MNKITSVAHAQEVLGLNIDFNKIADLLPQAGMPIADVEPLIAYYQLTLIIAANNKINGDWKADWSNWQQRKYFVWKETCKDTSKPSGFGFSDSGTFIWDSDTIVGARLTVGSDAEAQYIGDDFEDLFEKAWFIIPEVKQLEQAESN